MAYGDALLKLWRHGEDRRLKTATPAVGAYGNVARGDGQVDRNATPMPTEGGGPPVEMGIDALRESTQRLDQWKEAEHDRVNAEFEEYSAGTNKTYRKWARRLNRAMGGPGSADKQAARQVRDRHMMIDQQHAAATVNLNKPYADQIKARYQYLAESRDSSERAEAWDYAVKTWESGDKSLGRPNMAMGEVYKKLGPGPQGAGFEFDDMFTKPEDYASNPTEMRQQITSHFQQAENLVQPDGTYNEEAAAEKVGFMRELYNTGAISETTLTAFESNFGSALEAASGRKGMEWDAAQTVEARSALAAFNTARAAEDTHARQPGEALAAENTARAADDTHAKQPDERRKLAAEATLAELKALKAQETEAHPEFGGRDPSDHGITYGRSDYGHFWEDGENHSWQVNFADHVRATVLSNTLLSLGDDELVSISQRGIASFNQIRTRSKQDASRGSIKDNPDIWKLKWGAIFEYYGGEKTTPELIRLAEQMAIVEKVGETPLTPDESRAMQAKMIREMAQDPLYRELMHFEHWPERYKKKYGAVVADPQVADPSAPGRRGVAAPGVHPYATGESGYYPEDDGMDDIRKRLKK